MSLNTRLHQPPEYLNGDNYELAGDVWQLGLLLYWLLTLTPLFTAKTEIQLMDQIR